jgi:hypothetical protein
MRTPRPRALALGAIFWMGCAGEPPVPRDSPPDPGRPAEVDGTAVCLEGGPFVGVGELPVEPAGPGDAREISGLRWQAHEGCERLVIDLAGEAGSPATGTGPVEVEVLRGLGVVRVALTGVERVDPGATEATFAGPLARAAYAVRAPEGLFTWIDVHLGDAAEAHVKTLAEPARVVVDLRPGGGPVPPPPASERRVVVLQPRGGSASYPLTVTGYARHFEANVVVRIEQGGADVFETFTTATDWIDAWGHYSVVVEEGPAGPIRLHVGEHSARDGTWEGVAVDLEMRSGSLTAPM